MSRHFSGKKAGDCACCPLAEPNLDEPQLGDEARLLESDEDFQEEPVRKRYVYKSESFAGTEGIIP